MTSLYCRSRHSCSATFLLMKNKGRVKSVRRNSQARTLAKKAREELQCTEHSEYGVHRKRGKTTAIQRAHRSSSDSRVSFSSSSSCRLFSSASLCALFYERKN